MTERVYNVTIKIKKGASRKELKMKTYYIYNFQTDEFICEVRAWSIVDAEIRACKQLNIGSDDVYAFTERF